MGEVDEWVKERVRENRVHAFHHCYMLHHAHIHKSLCFVPNPNISGQMERVRESWEGIDWMRTTSSLTYVVLTMTHQSCTHQISSMGNATLKLLTAHIRAMAVIDAMWKGEKKTETLLLLHYFYDMSNLHCNPDRKNCFLAIAVMYRVIDFTAIAFKYYQEVSSFFHLTRISLEYLMHEQLWEMMIFVIGFEI